ncbi:hypothetical protein RB628_33495 [Streptomyces sp. ADMS]|uniref:hypothetical protein n=1 Tax=Streptomyces sp. ADMS TaxID=3071415 RepID=UPI00296FAA95|nr:hypothetical protein [Streptomyces sp. ADMS]MDW4910114.1 hypothetical protein [Streptomyces sp. ADMS]
MATTRRRARSRTSANLSVADGRAVTLGCATVSTGNSSNLGCAWNTASALSTDPAAITGARRTDGSLLAAPNFLVPRAGTDIGARFQAIFRGA